MTRALAMMALLSFALRAEDAPPSVPEVRTWKDLAATQEITLKDGVRAHLGIEALSAPAGSFVLLYLLTDKDIQPDISHDSLGPLRLVFDPARREYKRAKQKRVQRETPPAAYLWCTSLPVDGSTLTLQEGDRPVATVKVKDNALKFQPWLSLNARRRGREEEDDEWVLRLSNKDDAPCTPVIDISVPLLTLQKKDIESGRPLPHLLTHDDRTDDPGDPNEDIDALMQQLSSDDFDTREAASGKLAALSRTHLSWVKKKLAAFPDAETQGRLRAVVNALDSDIKAGWSGGRMHLEFPHLVDACRLQRCLLARWWINGQPFISKAPAPDGRYNDGERSKQWVNGATLAFKIDMKRLGAKPGDKMALQIMYAPREFAEFGLAPPMQELENDDAENNRPLVSNKVEFTVPELKR